MKWSKRQREIDGLKAKHGNRRSVQTFPDLSVKKTHPSLSDGFAPIQDHVQLIAQDHGLLVDTLHKQGPMVLFKEDLPYAGGRKS